MPGQKISVLRAVTRSTTFAVAGQDDLQARHRVMANLGQKVFALNSSIALLHDRKENTVDPVTIVLIDEEVAEATSESDKAYARLLAIATQPFNDPGHDAEVALANAIKAVDRAAANTAAINGLLAAVHGLVESYAADST